MERPQGAGPGAACCLPVAELSSPCWAAGRVARCQGCSPVSYPENNRHWVPKLDQRRGSLADPKRPTQSLYSTGTPESIISVGEALLFPRAPFQTHSVSGTQLPALRSLTSPLPCPAESCPMSSSQPLMWSSYVPPALPLSSPRAALPADPHGGAHLLIVPDSRGGDAPHLGLALSGTEAGGQC